MQTGLGRGAFQPLSLQNCFCRVLPCAEKELHFPNNEKGQRCIFYEAKEVLFKRKINDSPILLLPAPAVLTNATELYKTCCEAF